MTTQQDPSTLQPAAPTPDVESKFYWDGLRQNLVLLQRCQDCAKFRFPPMAHCPYCRSNKVSIEPAGGFGKVYSWIVVRQAFDPAFAADVPYTIATVDLDEGVRIAVRAERAENINFDDPVRLKIKHHAEWSELRVGTVDHIWDPDE